MASAGVFFAASMAQAQAARTGIVPAEFPPQDYAGGQYTDSLGCVFARAVSNGQTAWVPVLGADRQPFCARPEPVAAQAAPAAAVEVGEVAASEPSLEREVAVDVAEAATSEPVASADPVSGGNAAVPFTSNAAPSATQLTQSNTVPFGAPPPPVGGFTSPPVSAASAVNTASDTAAPTTTAGGTVVISAPVGQPVATAAPALAELNAPVRVGVELNPEYASPPRSAATHTGQVRRSQRQAGRFVAVSAANNYGLGGVIVPSRRGAWEF